MQCMCRYAVMLTAAVPRTTASIEQSWHILLTNIFYLAMNSYILGVLGKSSARAR